MDQQVYERSGSFRHKVSEEQVDFKEFLDQLTEYEKALGERLQAYHDGKFILIAIFKCVHSQLFSIFWSP